MSAHGDASEPDSWSYYPIHTIPRSLDIVWCRFPNLKLDEPGPKNRPALVRAVSLNKSHTKARLEVCYGTSKLKKYSFPFDLFIENAERLTALGLPQATRFELDRTLSLPWAKEFFIPKDGSLIIGRLGDREITRLRELTQRRNRRR